jgi:hypothetical protein
MNTEIQLGHVWLAQIKEVQGDRPAALLSWKEALSICERDKTWSNESMELLKEAIRKEIARIESPSQEDDSLSS